MVCSKDALTQIRSTCDRVGPDRLGDGLECVCECECVEEDWVCRHKEADTKRAGFQ